MAQIKCLECGEAISGIGKPCPKCGSIILRTERVIGFDPRVAFKWMLLIFILITVLKLVFRIEHDSLAPLQTQQNSISKQGEQNVGDESPVTIRIPDKETLPAPVEASKATRVSNPTPVATLVEPQPDILAVTLPSQPNQFAENVVDATKTSCRSNLQAIFDAALRMARKTKPNLLPVDLMELRTEFTNASVLICPSELPSIKSSLDWESFDPKLISYPVHGDLLIGARVPKPGIDYHYLKCTIHKIRITGNGLVMDVGPSTTKYYFPHR